MLRSRVSVLAAAAIFAVFTASAAQGAVLQQTRSFSDEVLGVYNVPGAAPAFNSYDGSAGVLTGVQLEWDIAANGGIFVDQCVVSADCDPGAYLLSLVGFAALAPAADSGLDFLALDFSIDDLQGAPFSVALLDSIVYADPSAFAGDGSPLAGFLTVSGSYLGHIGFFDNPSVLEATFTLTYLTDGSQLPGQGPDPVPLPPAMALFATGAGILGCMGWRRRRKTT